MSKILILGKGIIDRKNKEKDWKRNIKKCKRRDG